MNLLAISINHRTAPVELRELLHLNSDEIKALLEGIKKDLMKEAFVLSTCNRTEIYGIPRDNSLSYKDLENYLLDFKPVNGVKDEHFEKFFSCSAMSHLCKVSAGVDSQMTGDNQILGQVKEGFQMAEEKGLVSFLMKRVFDSATRVGKRAKTETDISEGAITISYAAIQLIEKIFSNFSKKSALVVGMGETGEIAARHLRDKGIGKLAVTNRTFSKAEKIASDLKGEILPFETYKEKLHSFDIIISATSSPEYLITFEDIKGMMKKRSNQAVVLMDIAVPRDFDPKVKSIENVFYNDIDSLNMIVEQNLTRRREEIPKVHKIIVEEMVAFFSWYNSLEIAPTIKNLRDYFEEVRSEEVEKISGKFSAEEREKLDLLTRRIINKLLHKPTVELKKSAELGTDSPEAAAKIALVQELFGIEEKRSNKE